MGKLELKQHSPGVLVCRGEGILNGDDLDKWRDEIGQFIRQSKDRGACGVLVDACEFEGFTVEAIDTVAEILADPQELIGDIRMRFALIGVKPFTQRFLREALPLEEIKHIRARFFHEVSEDEALAWLQAMVESADALPEAKPTAKKDVDSKGKPAMEIAKPVGSLLKTLPDLARSNTKSQPSSPSAKPAKSSEPAKTDASKGDGKTSPNSIEIKKTS